MTPPAGYSKRSLVDKLGIRAGWTIAVVSQPRGYRATLGNLPKGVRVAARLRRIHPFIQFFTARRAELGRKFPALARALAPGGMLWISWPKQASGVATDLTEDVIRTLGLPLGLVDVKVCAVDDVWSGLKFVWRKTAKA